MADERYTAEEGAKPVDDFEVIEECCYGPTHPLGQGAQQE